MTIDAQTEVSEETRGQQIEQADVNPDSSPEQAEGAENPNNAFQERINKVTAQKYEHQRRADKAEAELAKYKQEQAQKSSQTPPSNLIAPKPPEDMYDPEAVSKYHAEMLEYSQKMAAATAENAFKTQEQRQQEYRQKQQQDEQYRNYQSKAMSAGIDPQKLHNSELALQNAGITQELAAHLLNDANGPKIVEYLADNPSTMYEVLALNPMAAAVKIEAEIKQKALSTTPSVSSAPPPTPEFSGGGFQEKESFEKRYPQSQILQRLLNG